MYLQSRDQLYVTVDRLRNDPRNSLNDVVTADLEQVETELEALKTDEAFHSGTCCRYPE